MQDEGTEEVKRPARFIAEEVPNDEPVTVVEAPVMPEPEVEEPVIPHHISHSTSQFSAGMDTANLFPNSLVDEPRKSGGSNKGLILLTLVLLAAAVGVVGFIVYKRNKEAVPETAPIAPVTTTLASPSPTTSASPSAAMTFDRAKLKVKVQNGSGITGLAAKAKTYLLSLGYKDITTGNAASSDFEDTEVAVKTELQSSSSTIVNDLKDKYTVSAKVTTLDTNEDFDVVITLGKN